MMMTAVDDGARAPFRRRRNAACNKAAQPTATRWVRLTLIVPREKAETVVATLTTRAGIATMRVFDERCVSHFVLPSCAARAPAQRMPWHALWCLVAVDSLDAVVALLHAAVAPDELRWYGTPVMAQEGLA